MSTSRRFCVRIFPRLLLAMLFVAGIPFCGLWVIGVQRVQEEQQLAVTQTLQQAAAVLAAKVDAWIEMNYRIVQGAAVLPDIVGMEPARQNSVLRALGQTYPWAYLLLTIAPDGRNIGRSDGQLPKDYRDRRYVQQILQGHATGHEVLISRTTGQPALALSVPVRDARGHLAGIMAISSSLTEVSKATTDLPLGRTGFALLLDDTGQLVAQGRDALALATLQDLRGHPLLQGAEATQADFVADGVRRVGYRKTLPRGWSILLQQDYSEAFGVVYQTQGQTLILLAVTLALVLGSALLLTQRLVAPIRHLTVVADRISRGQNRLDLPLPEAERDDEIGVLARAIERLNVSLHLTFAPGPRG